MAYNQKYNSADYFSDNDYSDNNDEEREIAEKKAWDCDLNSEKFLNERAPPLERTNRVWLDRGLQMPRLGENDSTNSKIYDPNGKKNNFTDMVFEPPPNEFVYGHTDVR